MSWFEISGEVSNIKNAVSAKGNKYVTFCITDFAGRIYELSLFGDTLSFADKLRGKVVIKGVLSTRSYQDKQGNMRYAVDLRPQWVEKVGGTAAATTQPSQQPPVFMAQVFPPPEAGGPDDIPF